ncbi:molybdopterin-binding oxidoreductase, partial [Kitasatospora sp. NPDC059811]
MTDETSSSPPGALPRARTRAAGPAVAALCGLAAAAAAVGAGEAAAAFTRPQASPVVAIGSAAIDLAPTAVKAWAVQRFGTGDKAVLLGGIYTVMGLAAAALGVLAGRRRGAAAALFAAFGGLGAWAALARPQAVPTDLLPSAAAAGGAVAVLWWLTGPALSLGPFLDPFPGPSRRSGAVRPAGP